MKKILDCRKGETFQNGFALVLHSDDGATAMEIHRFGRLTIVEESGLAAYFRLMDGYTFYGLLEGPLEERLQEIDPGLREWARITILVMFEDLEIYILSNNDRFLSTKLPVKRQKRAFGCCHHFQEGWILSGIEELKEVLSEFFSRPKVPGGEKDQKVILEKIMQKV